MGADESTLLHGVERSDHLETLCRTMEQMDKARGSEGKNIDPNEMRQALLSAQDSIGKSDFGNNADFHKIIAELEGKTAADVKAEQSAKQKEDTRDRFMFTLRTSAEGRHWQAVVEELAERKGIPEDDLDEESLVFRDADGVEIDADTEEEPDWDTLRYPISGSICLKIDEAADVSWARDGSLTKKQIVEGSGDKMPEDSSRVKIKVVSATDGSQNLPGFEQERIFEFLAGNGDVCDALEIAALTMKQGEKAMFICSDLSLISDVLSKLLSEKAIVTLEMLDFEKAQAQKSVTLQYSDNWKDELHKLRDESAHAVIKVSDKNQQKLKDDEEPEESRFPITIVFTEKATDLANMSEDAKIYFGSAQKELGSKLFRKARINLALIRYRKALQVFASVTDQAKVKDLRRLCELNRAACYLKVSNYPDALSSCNTVLKEEPENVKALYRRAQCNAQLKNSPGAVADLKQVIRLDPQNKAARELFKEVQAAQKNEDQQSKDCFEKMLRKPAAEHKADPETVPRAKPKAEPRAEVRDEDAPEID